MRHLALMVLLFAAGCRDHRIPRPNYRPLTITPKNTAWSGTITLVADDQKFHIGNQMFLFRSRFVDRKFSRSAIRVPQQDLFGESLLEVAAWGRGGVVAHLGDALDLSCVDEWDSFSAIMNASGRESWFWTPGNHDGYFFGNFVEPKDQWQKACDGSAPMKKSQVLLAYLQHHLARYADPPLAGERGDWVCAAGKSCNHLRRAHWDVVRGDRYYLSYLIQEIDFPGGPGGPQASLILVDTNVYDRPPRIAVNEKWFRLAAGEQGRLGREQIRLMKTWAHHAVGEGRAVVLGGHHPFNALDEASQKAIDKLVSDGVAATYISAHTHWGQHYVHGDSGYSWLEPNLGSTIDYDSEFADLRLGFHDGTTFVQMGRHPTTDVVAGRERAEVGVACEDSQLWLAKPDDPDFYTNYMVPTSPRSRRAETLYYKTMLAALDRYWGCVPTTATQNPMPDQCTPKAPEVAGAPSCMERSEIHGEIAPILARNNFGELRKKVLELLARDRTRFTSPCLRREYRVCQSLWAAEYEKREYITPVRGDDTFEINTVRRESRATKP